MACFQHDMTYEHFKDLSRRTVSDKYYVIRGSKLLVILYMTDINADQHQWLIIFFDKKAGQTGRGISENHESSKELHRTITRKFRRHKVHSSYQDKSFGCLSWRHAITEQIQQKRVNFLLCVISLGYSIEG